MTVRVADFSELAIEDAFPEASAALPAAAR